MNIPVLLICASSVIILLLGSVHLYHTFFGRMLLPRDASVITAMQGATPYITRQTTAWDAWIGFNASHSLGAILFGLFFGYLAINHRDTLFDSTFLKSLGVITLLCYSLLAWRYWFTAPLVGISLALILFIAGITVDYRGLPWIGLNRLE